MAVSLILEQRSASEEMSSEMERITFAEQSGYSSWQRISFSYNEFLTSCASSVYFLAGADTVYVKCRSLWTEITPQLDLKHIALTIE